MSIKRYLSVVLLAMALLANPLCTKAETWANTSAELVVRDFGSYLSEWCATNDMQYLEKLQKLVSGSVSCRVEDGIMKALLGKQSLLYETKGTLTMDTYFNRFQQHIMNSDVSFSFGQPKETHEYNRHSGIITDTIQGGDTISYVLMPVGLKGKVNFSGQNLFLVRGRHITKIITQGDEDTYEQAIYEYDVRKNYDKAFQIVRRLAYANPLDYEAILCLVKMELWNKGCGFLSPTVRLTEAEWFLCRLWQHYYASGDPKMVQYCMELDKKYKLNIPKHIGKPDLQSLSSIYESGRLDFVEKNKNFPDLLTWRNHKLNARYASQGIVMTYKKVKDGSWRYGFATEGGKQIVSEIYTDVYHFGENGLAKVQIENTGADKRFSKYKEGYIDKQGKTVIPFEYDYCSNSFQKGIAYVFKGSRMYRINEKGQVLQDMGGGFTTPDGYDRNVGSFFRIEDKICYAVYNNTESRYQIFDTDGNMVMAAEEVNEYYDAKSLHLGIAQWKSCSIVR